MSKSKEPGEEGVSLSRFSRNPINELRTRVLGIGITLTVRSGTSTKGGSDPVGYMYVTETGMAKRKA